MLPRAIRTTLALAAVVGAASALAGCLVAAAGAGVGGGYALTQERPIADTVKDAGIAAAVAQSWKTYNPRLAEDLSANVYEARVLVTGTVPSEEWRGEAVKRAWQVDGVKEVHDEIQVGPDETFTQDLGDGAISNKLRAQMIGDGDVKSINFSVTTVKGVVYIMGSARSQSELNRVVDHARNIADVKRVVSYVRIRSGEPRKPETASSAPPSPSSARGGPPPGAAGEETISVPTPRQEIDVQPLQ